MDQAADLLGHMLIQPLRLDQLDWHVCSPTFRAT
jgi:hypothetical protein